MKQSTVQRALKAELARIAKWHCRFCFEIGDVVASWSKDPSTKVGAVIVDTDSRAVIAVGYNGFPRGVVDRPEWLADRAYKYPVVVHAEVNAILSAGATLQGATLYCNVGIPCPSCAGAIIQAGIKKVVFPDAASAKTSAKMMTSGTIDLRELSAQMFDDADVEMVEISREE